MAPPSVPSGKETASPHFMATRKLPGCPTFGSSWAAEITGGNATDTGVAPAGHGLDRQVRNVEVGHDRLAWDPGHQGSDKSGGNGRRRVPGLAGQHLVPALALDAESSDRLADSHAADSTGPGRESSTDGPRVIHGAAHVDSGVDAHHDQVNGGRRRRAGRT